MMNNTVQMKILFFLLSLFVCGCARNSDVGKSTKTTDSVGTGKQLTVAEQMALGDGNGDNLPPTYEEGKKYLLSQYDKVIHQDTLFMIKDDTFKLSIKYYCLKDKTLIIPKKFAFGSKNPKDFVTYDFAAKIMLWKGQDTLTNMMVKKAVFSELLDDKLNRFGSLGTPNITFNERDQILVRFAVGIPLTDLASNVYLVINKDGSTFIQGG